VGPHNVGVSVMSEKKHTGLKIGINNALASIELESGHKYRRYMTIAYLPTRHDLPSCLCVGNLEVSMDGEKEFYNPAKFYSHERLWDTIIHLIAAHLAFSSIKTGRQLYSLYHSMLQTLYRDEGLREKIRRLAEAYHETMMKLELSSQDST